MRKISTFYLLMLIIPLVLPSPADAQGGCPWWYPNCPWGTTSTTSVRPTTTTTVRPTTTTSVRPTTTTTVRPTTINLGQTDYVNQLKHHHNLGQTDHVNQLKHHHDLG